MNHLSLMPNKQMLITLLFLAFFSTLSAQNLSELSPKKWIEDLNQLEQLISEKHAKPFWLEDREVFSEAIYASMKELRKSKLTPEARILELMKVIASMKDGHSSLAGGDRYKYFGYVPMTVESFEEGFILSRVAKEHRNVLGSKLIGIEGMEIELVFRKLREIIPHANESRFLKFAPYYLHLPGLLYGLGISKDSEEVTFNFEMPSGQKIDVKMKNLGGDGETEMRELGDIFEELPLARQEPNRSYWFRYLEEEKLLYVKFNRVSSDKEESIWAFTERLFKYVDANPIDKFVIDIRDNGGGNGALSAALWKGIEENKKINQSGKLFVITGYKTFSAALSFASYLELRTQAIFVGQNPCDYINHPGDSEEYTLSNSGIRIRLSSLYHQSSFFQDDRQSLFPDHEIIPDYASLTQGRDKALEFIRNYKGKRKPGNFVGGEKLIGTYAFSPERHLIISEKAGNLHIEIEGKLSSPLYRSSDSIFETEVQGMRISVGENASLMLSYPDSKVRLLPKIKHPELSLLGYIYKQDLKSAEEKLLELKNTCPDCQLYKDHALSGLALEVLYDLRSKIGSEKARELAKEILRMAIRINPDRNEFATESLKYY